MSAPSPERNHQLKPPLPRPAGDLLAAVGTEAAETRLVQSLERSRFLAEASRAVSGALHVEKAIDVVLGQLVPQLVDWAQIVVRDGHALRCRARLVGAEPAEASVWVPSVQDSALGRVMDLGLAELLHVPPHEPEADDALAEVVPSAGLREAIAGIRPADLLCVPLTARGSTYGTLTVARRSGSGFDDDAVAFIEDFAQRMALSIGAARAYAERSHVARVLSRSLAPPRLPDIPGLRLASSYRIAFEHETLGGDFYDVHGDADDWTAVVGDVCGKGLEASVLTGRARQAVRTAALVDRSPSRVLDLVNRVLVADGGDVFVTLVVARVRRADHGLRVDLAGAGHPEPYLLRADGSIERVPVSGTVAGLFEDLDYTEVSVTMGDHDTCLLYTDGVTEAPGMHDRYGDERLSRVLSTMAGADVSAVVEAVALDVATHLGDRDHDDIALLGIQSMRDEEE